MSAASFGFTAYVCMSAGLAFLAMFFVQAIQPSKKKSIAAELFYALLGSVFLGLGSLFLLLASGVFV